MELIGKNGGLTWERIQLVSILVKDLPQIVLFCFEVSEMCFINIFSAKQSVAKLLKLGGLSLWSTVHMYLLTLDMATCSHLSLK